MTPSPALTLNAMALVEAIRVAANPVGKHPSVYRPAEAQAVRLARQCVRELIAAEWRETMAASVAASAHITDHYRADPPNVTIGPGHWTGD